jgi:hypothetical protein
MILRSGFKKESKFPDLSSEAHRVTYRPKSKAEEYKTLRILLAGHLRFRINRGDAIDQSLNRKTKTIKYRPLPRENPFHVPTQGRYQDGEDGHKQPVLNCAVEIHQPCLGEG